LSDRIHAGAETDHGVRIPHPVAFWSGCAAVAAGVGLHLPMYFGAADMHYRLVGMSPDPGMVIGMVAIVAGLIAATYGLIERERPPDSARGRSLSIRGLSIRGLDEAPLTRAHIALLAVMAVAVTIDAMKPIALGFVAPGMAKEYGLKSPLNPHGSVPVALLPVFGLSGTLIGSLAWGYLGDRIGRRASILLAGVLFVGTSICGAMPSYQWNFAMCLLMGIGVGGMLPITLTPILPLVLGAFAVVVLGRETRRRSLEETSATLVRAQPA
jgi:MFS transporter, putative metabolite:H+ symporter